MSSSFGQTSDLSTRLRGILHDYPDSSLLKEMLQNADDAGATVLKVAFDAGGHSCENLPERFNAEAMQGPALLVYNDGVFSDEDMKSIQSIGGSAKKGNMTKTGRFGIGFNSVYCISETPTFCSGGSIAYFDPSCEHLPGRGPGYKMDFSDEKNKKMIANHPNLFSPFSRFGCKAVECEAFNGTLFRLPLRTAEQAEESNIRKVQCTPEAVHDLLAQFQAEAKEMLVFLKNVQRLEVHQFASPSSAGNCVFSTSLANLAADDVSIRQFHTRIPPNPSTEQLLTVSSSLLLDVECGDTTHQCRVRQSTGNGPACALSLDPLAAAYQLKLLPWGGVCSIVGSPVKGKAFCFLPMPVATGLPVHINGYFELPSNRRSIFWAPQDTGEAKFRHDWNHALLTDVIAKEYWLLLKDVQRSIQGRGVQRESLYSLFPPRNIAEPWSLVSDSVAKELADLPCLWCESAGWCKPAQCLAANTDTTDPQVLSGLRSAGFVIAEVPAEVIAALEGVCTVLTAEAVLRTFDTTKKMSAAEAEPVLDWLLGEISARNGHRVPAHDADLVARLRKLPLAPTLSGKVVSFESTMLYFCEVPEVATLLRGRPAGDCLVKAADLRPSLLEKLQSRQWRDALRVSQLHRGSLFALLPQCSLPTTCTPNGSEQVTDTAALEFCRQLWKCSALLGNSFGDNWAPAEGWCIVPCGTYLCRLLPQDSDTVRVVTGADKEAGIDGVLRSAGVHSAEIPALAGYVEARTAAGCLRALSLAAKRQSPALSEGAPAVRAWLEASQFDLSPQEMSRAGHLPVWQLCGTPGTHSLWPTTVMHEDSRHRLLPAGILGTPAALLLTQHVNCTEGELAVLLRAGVPQLAPEAFWRWYIATYAVAGAGTDAIEALKSASQQILNAGVQYPKLDVRGAVIIPTSDGTLRALSSTLFDPSSAVAEMVPTARIVETAFATGPARGALLSLGMRAELGKDTVVDICRDLAKDGDVVRATAMLKHIDTNMRAFEDSGFSFGFGQRQPDMWTELSGVAWLPTLQTSAAPSGVELCTSAPLCLASDVRPLHDLWLCSSRRAVLSVSCGAALCKKFGWDAPLPAEVLVAQLLSLAGSGADTLILDGKVQAIYKELDKHRRAGTLGDALKDLSAKRCVWVGAQFVTPAQVAGRAASHELPGLYSLPAALRVHYLPLFLLMGVPEEFSPNAYAASLGRLAEEQGSTPLSEAQLQTVGSVLIHLEGDASHVTAQVWLPNEDGVMCLPDALLFDDIDWEAQDADLNGRAIVHKYVSHKVAESFGVVGRRMLVASEGFSDWDLGDAAVAYGQSESITSRIRTILAEYVADVGIFNEMLQNADDSGATEFTIMLDKQTYGAKSLLGKAMEAWQGPAVLVHNNARFTDADFTNLASVGKGAKIESTSKTGKFGLGFNATYHLTDVPSILSGGSLVFLDPHRKNIRGTTENAPGIKMKVPSREVFGRFPDQFAPFVQPEFKSDLEKAYDGTLFRFPLRKEASARQSDISTTTHTAESIMLLLASFADTSAELLLFLKHVRKVRVLVREEDGTVSQVCSHVLDMSKPDEVQHAAVYKFVAGAVDSKLSRNSLKERLMDTSDKDLPWELISATVNTQREGASHNAEWLLSTAVGGGETKSMAVAAQEARKFIPWGGVAVRCKKDGTPDSDVRGRAFAFLPLPQYNGLRFHVNGAFELSTNRRNIWFDDFDQKGERSLWNVALLKDPAIPATVRAFRHLRAVFKHGLYDLFPKDAQGLFAEFSKCLYAQLMSEEVLCAVDERGVPGEDWVCPRDAILVQESEARKYATQIKTLVLSGRKRVAVLPDHIADAFAPHGAVTVCPESVRDALRGHALPEGIVRHDVDHLLSYVMSDLGGEGKGFDLMIGIPLLPVLSVSGVLEFKQFTSPEDSESRVFLAHIFGNAWHTHYFQCKGGIFSPIRISSRDVKSLCACTNLCEMDASHLPFILRKCLPAGLFNVGRISQANHEAPDKAFVDGFWYCLFDLKAPPSIFEGELEKWPLIPTVSGNPENGGNYVDVSLAKTLLIPAPAFPRIQEPLSEALGVDLVDSRRETGFKYLETCKVVQKFSAPALLDAVDELHGNAASALTQELSPESRDRVLEYIVKSKGRLERRQEDVLRRLHLFRISPASSNEFRAFSTDYKVPPAGADHDILQKGRYYVSDRDLLVSLGAECETDTEFLTHLCEQEDEEDEEEEDSRAAKRRRVRKCDAVVACIEGMKQLDKELAATLRESQWVLDRTGHLKRPSQLFNLGGRMNQQLPNGVLPDYDVVVKVKTKLEGLGMRTSLDKWSDMLVWAEGLGGCNDVGLLSAFRTEAKRIQPAPEDEDFVKFRDVPCIPVRYTAVDGYPYDADRFPTGRTFLVCANELQPASSRALCSAFYCIAEGEEECFEWITAASIPCNVLVMQLVAASRMEGQVCSDALYKEMNARLLNEDTKADMEAALARQADAPLVCVGHTFLPASCVSLSVSPFSAAPYLLDMPSEVVGKWVDQQWEELGKVLGISRHFAQREYAECVLLIVKKFDGEPLDEATLALMGNIASFVSESEQPRVLTHLPNGQGEMMRISELMYNDMLDTDNKYGCVHDSVDNGVAAKLGARSRKESFFLENELSKKLNCPPEEELAARMQTLTLLDLLRDVLEVSNMLGATSLAFTLDTAQHEIRHTIPGTDDEQGPGVLVVMDKEITCQQVEQLMTMRTRGGGAALATCFTVSDCVQVVSKNDVMIFNPLNKPCCFGLDDVRKKFPSHLNAFRGAESKGIAIRFALRRECSTLGEPCDVATMQKVLSSLSVHTMLPLLPFLLSVSFSECGPVIQQAEVQSEGEDDSGADTATETVAAPVSDDSIRLVSRCNVRFATGEDDRTTVWASQEWKTQSMMSFLKTKKPDVTKTFSVDIDVFEPTEDRMSEKVSVYHWGVTLRTGGVAVSLHDKVDLAPVGGVAALLSVDQTQPNVDTLRASSRHLTPMPQMQPPTGLPVQLLSVTAVEREGLSLQQIQQWNNQTKQNAYKAYAVLLQEMCNNRDIKVLTPKACYNYWPDDKEAVDMAGVKLLYTNMSTSPVFALGNVYKQPTAAKFAHFEKLEAKIDSGALRAVSSAVSVFNVPQYVARGMCLHSGNKDIHTLSSNEVCRIFHTNSSTMKKVLPHLQTPQQVISLLEIAAHGLNPTDVERLKQVHLLPMGDGEGRPVIKAFAQGSVLVGGEHERRLFPDLAPQFVHPDVMKSKALDVLLRDAKVQRALQLQTPPTRRLLDSMGSTPVPAEWKNCTSIRAEEAEKLPQEWVESLWKTMTPQEVVKFEDWPLVPVEGGGMVACSEVQSVFNFSDAPEAPVVPPPAAAAAQAPSGVVPLLGSLIGMVVGGSVGQGQAVEQKHYDPITLREPLQRLGVPIMAQSFGGGARFQPKGTAPQIVAEKLKKLDEASLVEWDAQGRDEETDEPYPTTDEVAAYFAQNARDFAATTHAQNVRKLPLFAPLADPSRRVSLTKTQACAAPKGTPFLNEDHWYVFNTNIIHVQHNITQHNTGSNVPMCLTPFS